jgi:hypothetical protein
LANSYRVHLGVLSLSQGWKPWAEIGKRLWRSTFVQGFALKVLSYGLCRQFLY